MAGQRMPQTLIFDSLCSEKYYRANSMTATNSHQPRAIFTNIQGLFHGMQFYYSEECFVQDHVNSTLK